MEEPKKIKFGLLHYYKPTPVLFRKIGDLMLGVSGFIATSDWTNPKKSMIVLLSGIAGKVLTNFFTFENEK